MVVPFPFTRAVFLYGDPIVVTRDEDVETARLRLEAAMNDLARRADSYFEEGKGMRA